MLFDEEKKLDYKSLVYGEKLLENSRIWFHSHQNFVSFLYNLTPLQTDSADLNFKISQLKTFVARKSVKMSAEHYKRISIDISRLPSLKAETKNRKPSMHKNTDKII